jgi:hypothetical protein
MKDKISGLKELINIGQYLKIVLIVLFLTGCSDKKTENPPDNYTSCIVTDKSKLEEINIFSADNALNRNISQDPVDSRSDAIIAFIGSPWLKADFGSGLWEGAPIGIPFMLVCNSQSKIPVTFRGNDYDANYGNESDPGPYPIPLSAPVEGNGAGDSHVLAVDIDNKILYELYNAGTGTAVWEASAGAIWDLKINDTRPEGWTSADAAGLPVLPLLIRYEEVASGEIDHAIRFTLSKSKVMHGYTSPASHLVNGSNSDEQAPTPMGLRLRLKADFDISGFSVTNQVILNAMKNYGLILADIGSDLFITGAPDDGWDNDDLSLLKSVNATDFEVVQMGDIIKN